MKYAADFRSIARDALSGRWLIAVLAGFLASLLGGVSSRGTGINLNSEDQEIDLVAQKIRSAVAELDQETLSILLGVLGVVLLIALAIAVVFFVIGSVVGVGYSKFNLDLVDRQENLEINTLFAYFKNWKTAAAANLWVTLRILLGLLLFIIPGIIAIYSYAMTFYVLAENPELSAREALQRSKEMMTGNRFRLFCLQWSFIGWVLLSVLTLGLGMLWLVPYQQAALAAFYREVSGTERAGFRPVLEA